MKWTRTEEIEFEPNDIPDDIYRAFAPKIMADMGISISCQGGIHLFNEWCNDGDYIWKTSLIDEMRTASAEADRDWLVKMLKTLDEARAIIADALPHNAPHEGPALVAGPLDAVVGPQS